LDEDCTRALGLVYFAIFPSLSFFFSSYDYLKRLLVDTDTRTVSSHKLLLAGALSATLASGLVTPADVVKTRLQNGTREYKSYTECVRHILSDGGYKAFFRGLTPRLLIIAPMFGIQFMIFENLLRIFFPS